MKAPHCLCGAFIYELSYVNLLFRFVSISTHHFSVILFVNYSTFPYAHAIGQKYFCLASGANISLTSKKYKREKLTVIKTFTIKNQEL